MSGESQRIVRAQSGDRAAFDALIAPRWERICRIARRIVGDRQDAEDVAQAACLRIWTTLHRFRAGEDLDGWIYRIVVNLAIDALRRRRARREDAWPVSADDTWSFDPPGTSHGPDVAAFAGELERLLDAATRTLPPRQKAVFVLSRVEGLTAPQIGRILGISASTVRNHLAQLRQTVAAYLRRSAPDLLSPDEDPE